MKISSTDIRMIRGDSESIIISCETPDGTAHPFENGDCVFLTVKTSEFTEEKMLQKHVDTFENGKAIIILESADTKGVPFGTYRYDVQLTRTNGQVTTIIEPSDFVIGGEVTYE